MPAALVCPGFRSGSPSRGSGIHHRPGPRWAWQAVVLLAGLLVAGCRATGPSNYRNWRPDQALLPTAHFEGGQVTVGNVRNCYYLSGEEYVVDHYDKTFSLDDVRTVDFLVVPFRDMPRVAHTMLSFGLADHSHLALSVETRREQGETYAPWKGSARQYELMYVIGDERDLIGVRAAHRGEDVYLYRGRAAPAQVQDLFVDVLHRCNQLAREPEYYDTLTNNCTTNLMRHINRLRPGRIPYDYRVLLPGHSDRLAYDLDLIERKGTFAETRRRAYLNPRVARHAGRPDFSRRIREADPGSLVR